MILSLSSQNVSQYLINAGVCTQQDLENLQIESKQFNKNFNLLIELSDRSKLLIKQERRGGNGQTANEFLNEWQFHRLLEEFPDLKFLTPSASEVKHFDESNSILVYNYLIDYQDIENFYSHQEQAFPTVIATSIGTILAQLHRATFNSLECRDFISQTPEGKSRLLFGNPARPMERIGPEIFGLAAPDYIKFLVLYQRYESLGMAIADLASNWSPCCIVHNDLKLNNILIRQEWEQFDSKSGTLEQGTIRVIDWERCNWGDPAFDLGTILANYLLLWLNSLVVDPSIQLEESLRLATRPLEVMQPSIAALAKAYLSNFPEILVERPDFFKRVVQFTGLALITQIRATIEYQKILGNTGICMLQVAKSLLCRPEQSFLSIFGIPESELHNISLSAA